MKILDLKGLETLLRLLDRRGFGLVGPVAKNGVIVYDRIHSLEDFPAGWTDIQDGGTYRLAPRTDNALFGYSVGPDSLKKFLFPPQLKIWSAKKSGKNLRILKNFPETPRLAIFGVRSCELRALLIQDKIFLGSESVNGIGDPYFQAQRENLFLIAVNCTQAGGTCFCHSMGTGPRVKSGYDLLMTEILDKGSHYFTLESGSTGGEEVLGRLPGPAGGEKERLAIEGIIEKTIGQMARAIETRDLQELLYDNQEHPRWEVTAKRCLACGNCTMVCPTCFCSTPEDTLDLSGTASERIRRWDSCFSPDFSYLHGGSVRVSVKARYRQWLTHKLAGWIEQFGVSGCVGCGRCITWCPPGIDLTEEVEALGKEEGAS